MAIRGGAGEVVGIDLRDQKAKLTARASAGLGLKSLPSNLKLETVEPGHIPGGPGAYDLIYSWSVVEHVDRHLLRDTFAMLRDALADTGWMFIQIAPLYFSSYGHHIGWTKEYAWAHLAQQVDEFKRTIDGVRPLFQNRMEPEYVYDTLNRLTAEELKDLLEEAGFFVERQHRTFETDPPDQLYYAYRPEVVRCEQVVYLCRKQPSYGHGRPKITRPEQIKRTLEPLHTDAQLKLSLEWPGEVRPRDTASASSAHPANGDLASCLAANGSLVDFTVLDVGAGDGYNTYCLELAGAKVVGLEEAWAEYLRCLQIKNEFGLRAQFVHGDTLALLEQLGMRFDLGFVAGSLHTSRDPVALLDKVMALTDRLYLRTYVIEAAKEQPGIQFSRVEERTFEGVPFRYHVRAGEEASGAHAGAYWMELQQLLVLLRQRGFGGSLKWMETPGGRAISAHVRRL
jgi:2-polyprenyl-3-methyl-5-hydroxy-6-metoxy-1,4-benzoquinol methylase